MEEQTKFMPPFFSFHPRSICLLPRSYEAAVIVPHRSQGPRGGGPPYSHAPRHRV